MGFPLFFAFVRGLSQSLFSSLSFWLLCLFLFSYIFLGVASDPAVPLSGLFWFWGLSGGLIAESRGDFGMVVVWVIVVSGVWVVGVGVLLGVGVRFGAVGVGI
jgi:hypothetical protein